MGNYFEKILKKNQTIYLFGILLWTGYVISYVILGRYSDAKIYAGILGTIIEFSFNFITILLTFYLWRRALGQAKIIFLLFCLSLLLELVDNSSYNIIVDVLGITNYSGLIASIFDIPFLGFLVFQFLAWITIFVKMKLPENNRIIFIPFLPLVTIGLVIFGIFIVSIVDGNILVFSLKGFYIMVETCLQTLGFIFALLCFCMAIKRQVYYISIGYLTIITCCFLVHYHVLDQTLTPLLYLDTVWSLGTLFMIFGFYELWQEKRRGIETNVWLSNINGIQTQCSFWGFLLCMTSLIAFWLVSYMFIGNILFKIAWLQYLLPILIIFSVLSILISAVFARTLSAPFGRLESVIDSFIHGKNVEIIKEKEGKLPFAEFEHLEGFLIKAFEVLKERNKAQQALANCTAHVAHDIRKPFSMLKSMLPLFPNLTPDQIAKNSAELDVTIRKVEAMLSDIMEASREAKYDLTPGNVLGVLDMAIKDVSRYRPKDFVDFYYDFDVVNLINLDEKRMCRAFENTIDNAFDFLSEQNGFMWFSVKSDNNKAKIVIGNSYSCIPEDEIEKIFQDKFTSGKKGGTGLGLSIVTKVINGHDGVITVRNVERVPGFVPENIRNTRGVEFEITLPLTDRPGYNLKDPVLRNSEEAKAVLGMIQKETRLAGSSEIDILIKNLGGCKQKPNMLILDDESIYRMRVRDVLENLEGVGKYIHVYDASSYKEAIELLDHTKIDYLICDIDLSDRVKTGFSVLIEAKRKYPDCKVLMHTNRKESEDINRAEELGACGFCPKPITEAILVDFLLEKELWKGGSCQLPVLSRRSVTKTDASCQKNFKVENSKFSNPAPRPPIPDSRSSKLNILIVNDERAFLDMLLYTVEFESELQGIYNFFSAYSYKEGKEIIDQNNIDILISDLNLGTQEDGVDLCKYLTEKGRNSVRIIHSGIGNDEAASLKRLNLKYLDEVFSASDDFKEALTKSHNILKQKRLQA